MPKCTGRSPRVLLVSMPFAPLCPPSPQLGALEAYLASKSISVDSYHAYLKCADYLGIELYDNITSGTSGAYLMRNALYSAFMFPEYFAQSKQGIEQTLEQVKEKHEQFDLTHIIERLDTFNKEVMDSVNWQNYDLIGFTVNFSQLLPSLFIARLIKLKYPHLKIVFGGFMVTGQLGLGVMKAFPFVDYIVSGEGENALLKLTKSLSTGRLEDVMGLIYRKDGEIAFNDQTDFVDLDTLPFYKFDSYYELLKKCKDDTRMHCEINMFIPIEGSRGCWWGKCNFCNLCMAYRKYREKSVGRIVEELKFQSEKYQLLSVFFLDEAIRPKKVGELFDTINGLGQDFIIMILARANNFTKQDMKKMYDAGVVSCQVGIESFSTNLLNKMRKGVRAIQNIEVIKNCLEVGINMKYTLMHSFPYQDKKDLEETLHTLEYLESFPPPIGVFAFELQYGSPIFYDFSKYNIASIHSSPLEALHYPPEIMQNLSFRYNYSAAKSEGLYTTELATAITDWMARRDKRWRESMGVPSLYYNRGANFLVIHDTRQPKKNVYVLSELEGRVYAFCDKIRRLEEIFEEFKDVSKDEILRILKDFEQHKLIFSEDNEFLSLAVKFLPHRDTKNSEPSKHKI